MVDRKFLNLFREETLDEKNSKLEIRELKNDVSL
jgi:hypothetical protein